MSYIHDAQIKRRKQTVVVEVCNPSDYDHLFQEPDGLFIRPLSRIKNCPVFDAVSEYKSGKEKAKIHLHSVFMEFEEFYTGIQKRTIVTDKLRITWHCGECGGGWFAHPETINDWLKGYTRSNGRVCRHFTASDIVLLILHEKACGCYDHMNLCWKT